MANRSANGRFAPGGGSDNPGGQSRYEKAAIKRCQESLGDSIEALIQLTRSEDETVRLKAIGMVLDRGIGRPVQRKDMDVSGQVKHEHGWSKEFAGVKTPSAQRQELTQLGLSRPKP